jgi:hypothetical protein
MKLPSGLILSDKWRKGIGRKKALRPIGKLIQRRRGKKKKKGLNCPFSYGNIEYIDFTIATALTIALCAAYILISLAALVLLSSHFFSISGLLDVKCFIAY